MSKTPTIYEAEKAAELLGLESFDLAICLRDFAVTEIRKQAEIVRNGAERPNLGRFQRLLRAAEACEAAWDETLDVIGAKETDGD